MIGALKGIVIYKKLNAILLMVHGVGYRVHAPAKLLSRVEQNEELFIHTYVYRRDNESSIYGFASREELDLFELLLGVSGVGPKIALEVVDRGVDAVTRAVSEADVAFFTTVPRLGKKNAQKVIIELKSKLGAFKELDLSGEAEGETTEVIAALESFGFDKSEIHAILAQISPDSKTVEDKVKAALKMLGTS